MTAWRAKPNHGSLPNREKTSLAVVFFNSINADAVYIKKIYIQYNNTQYEIIIIIIYIKQP